MPFAWEHPGIFLQHLTSWPTTEHMKQYCRALVAKAVEKSINKMDWMMPSHRGAPICAKPWSHLGDFMRKLTAEIGQAALQVVAVSPALPPIIPSTCSAVPMLPLLLQRRQLGLL
jgi:hypothetical protein